MEHSEQKKRSWLYPILLVLIILVQCVFYTYIFLEKKTAYHEDEFFSYALSNSYKRPYLYGSDLQVCDNYDVWMTGDTFRYYLRTNEDTKFSYDSVWWNQQTDTNPPFYYAVLHTISSVFCGDFSWWYAYSINLVCFVLSQVFLYLLVIQLCRSKNIALIVCAFRAFTVAAQGDNLFLRMYCMLTMFGIMYAYFSLKVLLAEKQKVGNWIAVALTAFLGAMTQHLFLVFAFLVTAVECLFLLGQKKWKAFFCYGFSAAVGVLLSFAAFPATYQHLFHGRFVYSSEPDMKMQSFILTHLMLNSAFGISIYSVKEVLFWLKVGLLFIVPICLPILFLFRKQIPSAAKKIAAFFKKTASRSKKYLPQFVILLVSCIAFLFLVSSRFCYDDFQEDSIRYVYLIMPLLVAVIIGGIALIVKCIRQKAVRGILYFLLTACLVVSLVWQNHTFEPRYIHMADLENGRVSDYIKGMDCILLPNTPIYMPIFSEMFSETGDVYETIMDHDYYRTESHEAEYQKIFDRNQPFMLVFDGSSLLEEEFYQKIEEGEKSAWDEITLKQFGENWSKERVVSYFEDLSGYTAEFCTAETTHFNRIYAYRMIPN